MHEMTLVTAERSHKTWYGYKCSCGVKSAWFLDPVSVREFHRRHVKSATKNSRIHYDRKPKEKVVDPSGQPVTPKKKVGRPTILLKRISKRRPSHNTKKMARERYEMSRRLNNKPVKAWKYATYDPDRDYFLCPGI